VVAVDRSPGKLTVRNAKPTVVTGQLSDRGAIDAAVRDADGVISALGPSLDRRATGMPLVAVRPTARRQAVSGRASSVATSSAA
jgi:hypothetical protein